MPTITNLKVEESGKYEVKVELKWEILGHIKSRSIVAPDAVKAMRSLHRYMEMHDLNFDVVGDGEYIGMGGFIHEGMTAREVYTALDAYAEEVWGEMNKSIEKELEEFGNE